MKLTKQKAIAKYCKECSGNAKEVTLCNVFDCPLWQYRCGYHMSSQSYKPRIQNAFRKYKLDVRELKVMGYTIENFLAQG
ncbi:unnamed protein product [marine sediment metagenome]|uniref:Uncharacterized protein n=1 Tax=marine sediment metagenome TaxID=412755 RepID=X1A5M3_9ZZZZ